MYPDQDFPESNFTFNKPANMTDDQCGPLKVHKGIDGENFPIIISKWKLTDEELEQIKTTGVVYLTIYGSGMPPVSLSVQSPLQ